MLSFSSLLLLGMAVVMAVLVAMAARALLHGERVARAYPERTAHGGRGHRALGRWVRLTRVLEQRFLPGSALGLQLTISVVVAIAALWLFGEVADNVIDRDKLSSFDAQVLVMLAPWRTPDVLAAATLVSRLGTSLVMSAFALVLVLTLYRRDWRAIVVGWTLVLAGGKLVEAVLKQTIHRIRPIGALQHLGGPSYSYPSGHAMGAMIGYGLLAYLVLLRVRRPARRAAVTATAALIILAIGVSRLLLAVHYFTDVVGGYAAGAVWLALSIAAVDAARERVRTIPSEREHRHAA